jgi:CheY-like chemotaxis protein
MRAAARLPVIAKIDSGADATRSSGRVLLAEDNADYSNAIGDMLEGFGYRVVKASSPTEIDRIEHRGKALACLDRSLGLAGFPPAVAIIAADRQRDEPNSSGRAQSNPQAEREPRVTNTPPQNGNADRPGRAETRGAPDQKGNVIVQDARRFPRIQENAPDGKTKANPERANKQGDSKNADDQEKADDRKSRGDRERN